MENENRNTTDNGKTEFLPFSDVLDMIDIMFIINALLKTGGNITQTAKELDIGRRTLYDMLDKYGISCANGKISIQLKPILSNMELRVPFIEKYISE